MQMSMTSVNATKGPTPYGYSVLTIVKGKLLCGILVKHEGEYLLAEVLLAVLPVLAAIHEDIELPGVRVQVTVECDATFLLKSEFISLTNFGIKFG